MVYVSIVEDLKISERSVGCIYLGKVSRNTGNNLTVYVLYDIF